jgi:Mg2+ and Co2+ transporter CorA
VDKYKKPRPSEDRCISRRVLNFHRLNFKDCLSNIQVLKIDTYADHIFIILYLPAVKKQNVGDKNTASEKEDIYEINQLCIFLGNRGYIVTLHHDKLTSLAKMFQQYANDCENNGRSDDKIL